MNLRLAVNEIRFRVSSVEAERLLETSELCETISLGSAHSIKIQIGVSESFNFECTNSEFKLKLPRSELQKVFLGKNRAEMSWNGTWSDEATELNIVFEVDAFSKKIGFQANGY